MGMIVSVYRDADSHGIDCTRGGISSQFHRLCVINIDGPFEPDEKSPGVRLESHVRGALRVVPIDSADKWLMFGGNYASTSDSRFREACEKLIGHYFYGAVAIHDRIE